MSAFTLPLVTVAPPRRGPGSQPALRFQGSALAVSRSWGSQPDEGKITYVPSSISDLPSSIVTGSWLQVDLYGRSWWGVCQNGPGFTPDGTPLPTLRSSGGNEITIAFWDERLYLDWDVIYGVFNRAVTHMVGGRRVRQWKHLFPVNFRANLWTYTQTPYTPAQLIRACFESPTTQSPWVPHYHPDQVTVPFWNELNAENGLKLGDILSQLSEWQGVIFTVGNGVNAPVNQPFHLYWQRRGEGVLPSFGPDPVDPITGLPLRSDQQQLDVTLSGAPTRVQVVGDRNLYLCLGLTLLPDWNRAWETFPTIETVADWLVQNVPAYSSLDPVEGGMLAQARALEITVAEFAALYSGAGFQPALTDTRRFSGQNRMDLPVALYLDLVWRAFRLPPALAINGLAAAPGVNLDLTSTLHARVTHDPTTGTMTADPLTAHEGSGYVIVQGLNVAPDLFASLDPERFSLTQFNASQHVWRQIHFEVDASDQSTPFVLLAEPVFQSDDFITVSENRVASQNAAAVRTLPAVRAALCFQWDTYFLTWPQNANNPGRDQAVSATGLHAEYLVGPGTVTSSTLQPFNLFSGVTYEIPFPDGFSADAKAVAIATPLLSRQYRYVQGRFERPLAEGDVIPNLTGLTARIGVQISDAGQTALVELTTERTAQTYVTPTDLDRRSRLNALLPGVENLRHQANQLRQGAAVLRRAPGEKEALRTALAHKFGSVKAETLVRLAQ